MEWEGEGEVSWSGHQRLRVEVSSPEVVQFGIRKSVLADGQRSLEFKITTSEPEFKVILDLCMWHNLCRKPEI